MQSTTVKSHFRRGMRAGWPQIFVIVPFAALFGVVGTEAGLNIAEVMGFSFLVIAGAAQFAAVQLLSENAPTVTVLATALAVNLRMAMYSASLVPHLGAAPLWKRALVSYFLFDQPYAMAMSDAETSPQYTASQRASYYLGVALPVAVCWCIATTAGGLLGKAIPDTLALDFMMPIMFLAIVAPMIRSIPHLTAAIVSVVAALVFAGLPYGAGLLLAALLAMVTGALVQTWQERRNDTSRGAA